MNRVWAMPSHKTFSIKPIRQLVKWHLAQAKLSVDPFARNNRWATYTNDLNPDTAAEYHLTALDFLKHLQVLGVKADLVLFDPPYSIRQVKEVYDCAGIEFMQSDTQNIGHWGAEKDICQQLLTVNGIFIHFGWHSNGIGIGRGFELNEMLVVAHGRAHNDTIVTVERKLENKQTELFTG